jgi:hypothetical protein
MNGRKEDNITRILLLAPIIFVFHFLEESPTFVEWFNSHVSSGITSEMFWNVNFSGLIITLIVVWIEWFSRSVFSLIIVIAWFACSMLANAIFHLAGGLIDQKYVPGLITAFVLYLPYFFWLFIESAKSRRVNIRLLLVAAVTGAIPMLAHGYFILFRGRRLF